jgi:hypothetical protein
MPLSWPCVTWRSRPGPRQNEEDVAAHLVGFLKQFLKIFSELKGKKFYVTGESVSTRREL